MTALVTEAEGLLPELVALRRAVHRDPEIGLHLPRTQGRVLDALHGLGLRITTGTAASSVTAVVHGARPGPTVLLRADMDGLPLVEDTGLEFAATNGAMHACGHDLHTAGLVGAGRLLAAHREELAGDVVLMFQPGEEADDGAAVMIGEGVLTASGSLPVAAYAAHVVPGPAGTFRTRAGTVMAGVADLRIVVRGVGGHGSRPHDAVDPVPAVAALVTALQVMVTRRFSVFDPVVVTVTQLSASDAINVVPETATLGGTIRTLSRRTEERVRDEVRRVAAAVAEAHGCEAEVVFSAEYPVLVNDDGEASRTREVLADVFGAERSVEAREPLMASEDFARVLDAVPGALVLLSASPAEIDPSDGVWNHSPKVRFDDGVLGDLAAAFATLALRRLRTA